jgi:hypothetical protein
MAPIREFLCIDCGHINETLVRHPEDMPHGCDHCESTKIELLPALIGGYNGDTGSGSTKPRNSGAFKTRKVVR